MKTDAYKLEVIFLTPVLGSQPSDPNIASKFIAKRAGFERPEDEEQFLPEALEKGTTVFYRYGQDQPALMNYQVLGFLKESGKVQNGRNAGGVKALRSKVGSGIFVHPRVIPLHLPEGGLMEYLERPLRIDTAKGQLVSLARSEMLPAGTSFTCYLEVLRGEISQDVLVDLLDYGFYRGLGQWRNSGAFGTFRYVLTRLEDDEVSPGVG